MMSRLQWEWNDTPVDDRPLQGPACPGVQTHRWTLTINEGDIHLWSGCEECESVWEPHFVEMSELTGRLAWEHEHPPGQCPSWLSGPCDHSTWLRFIPEGEAS